MRRISQLEHDDLWYHTQDVLPSWQMLENYHVSGSNRTLQEATGEQDQLRSELQTLRKSLQSAQSQRDRHNQQLHKMQSEKNSVVEQQLKVCWMYTEEACYCRYTCATFTWKIYIIFACYLVLSLSLCPTLVGSVGFPSKLCRISMLMLCNLF